MKIYNLEEQRALVFGEQPEINLVGACKLGSGVIQHSSFEKKRFIHKFIHNEEKVTLFIPASGSGSRMFQFLYDFLEEPNDDNRSKTEKFLNAIESFAFFELLPYESKKKVRTYDIDLDEFVAYLLKKEGLGLGGIPKGLLPFHRSRSFVLNAFQEHLLQGLKLKEANVEFHFTINERFEDRIFDSLKNIEALTARKTVISCSSQDSDTDAYAFDENQKPVKLDDGSYLTRPSGHGALLSNLNSVDSDIIFIKNIDNIQHESIAEHSIENFQYLGGMLLMVREEIKQTLKASDIHAATQRLNEIYQFWNTSNDITALDKAELTAFLSRPIRVCGMVRNEGQPGGGPFWVENNGAVTKQIVEKAQIKMRGEQYRLMVQSQYFNPVLMALSTRNAAGDKLDLTDFSDEDKFFTVDKKFKGKPIKYMERPGLWNGSMANWLTVFVEVSSETFTPVKNVLDLLSKSHREQE